MEVRRQFLIRHAVKNANRINNICYGSIAPIGPGSPNYEGWNFNSGNYLFTTDTK